MLDLVYMVQKIVTFLHLASEIFAMNEKDLQQALGLVKTAKRFPCLRGSFITPTMRMLIVRQIGADDRHGFFKFSLNTLGCALEGGASLVPSTISERSIVANNI